MSAEYRICQTCVMDTSDPAIEFYDDGSCNHCKRMADLVAAVPPLEVRTAQLERTIEKIRADGKGHDYDCLIGVSGGVDSTYVAHLLHKHGLRPLAIHLDNGWNSELAVSNIKKVLDRCGIELITHVIDWEEYKDLQLSFLKASIPGMEIPTDHAIFAWQYAASRKYGIRHVVTGTNLATEGIMPQAWSESRGQHDWLLIKNIQKRFGTKPLRTFPHFSMMQRFYYKLALRNVNFAILNYVDYNKEAAIKVLEDELGWVYYGGKHYESIYTRFTQGYIQPRKFGFDKRRAHLSALIVSGQKTRDEALMTLTEPCYPSEALEREDMDIFKKKLGLSDSDFEELMGAPTHSYLEYPGYSTTGFYKAINENALKLHFALRARGFYRSGS